MTQYVESSRTAERTRLIIQLFSLFVACVAVAVVFGWIFEYYPLVQILPHFVAMQFNTASCFFVLSVSIFFSARKWRILPLIGALFVFLLAGASLLQYILDMNFGIDEFFFEHKMVVKASHRGRMAPNTALDFCFLSLGIFLISLSKKVQMNWVAAIMAALAFPIAFVALMGYALDVRLAYGWFDLTHMALHTSFCFNLLSISVYLLSWSYRSDGTASKWVVIPLGLASLFIFFSVLHLLDVAWVTYTPQMHDEIIMAALALLLGLSAFLGVYIFKKTVNFTQALEWASLHEAQRNRDQGMLLYYLNEEVRAPLFAIIGYLEMLALQAPSVAVNNALLASGRVRHVLDDLVVIMQQEEGLQEVIHEIDFGEFKHSLIAFYQQRAIEQEIRFDTIIEGSLFSNISIDREKVQHIASFLLHHAFNRSASGQTVQLILSFVGSTMKVAVKDHGSQLDREAVHAILTANPFHTPSKIDRMQLGFYVCNKLLECLRSRLIIKSSHEYTEFSFVIGL